jgi:hypothetical protein
MVRRPMDVCCPCAFTVTTGTRLERETYTTQGLNTIDGQMFPKAEKVVSKKEGKTSTLVIRYSDIKFEVANADSEGKK